LRCAQTGPDTHAKLKNKKSQQDEFNDIKKKSLTVARVHHTHHLKASKSVISFG